MSELTGPAEEEILSDLAHKLVDQVALYGLAREIAAGPDVMEAIQRVKEARAQLLHEINGKIWLNGVSQIEQGNKLGSAQKAFARMKGIQEKSDSVALDEVARGETYLRERFAQAAQDNRLTAHTQNYLETVVSRIEAMQDKIAGLRVSYPD